MTEKHRGLCCHEVGHAVVAWSFGVRVVAVYVTFSVARGWHGGIDFIYHSVLPYMDQITNLAAGKSGEEVFECAAPYGAWLADFGEICVLLNNNGIPEDKHWLLVTEARDRARLILENYREGAVKLIDRLTEAGHVGEAEFLRLMQGES